MYRIDKHSLQHPSRRMISNRNISPLAFGYSYEIDSTDERTWYRLLQTFDDGNIYQTQACAKEVGGRRNICHLVLKLNDEIVAIALAKVKKLPVIGLGIASVFRGPIWRKIGTSPNVEFFRQAVRALRNEFVCRQGLALRVYFFTFEDDALGISSIFADEMFSLAGNEASDRTILMDLGPSLVDLRQALSPMWTRNLKTAIKSKLEVIQGTSDEMFGEFIGIYEEMVSRKNFTDAVDIYQYRQAQAQLPDALKMNILLCKSEAGLCSGLIYS